MEGKHKGALYFQNFENQISKFQKNLETNMVVVTDIYYKCVTFYGEIRYIIGYIKISKVQI
jgi:hypothetical protein